MLHIAALIIITVLFVYYYSPWSFSETPAESFRSCSNGASDCSTSWNSSRGTDGVLPRDGIIVLNPFIAPYSSTQCVDDLYIQAKDQKRSDLYLGGPLTNLSSPDHVVLTN